MKKENEAIKIIYALGGDKGAKIFMGKIL